MRARDFALATVLGATGCIELKIYNSFKIDDAQAASASEDAGTDDAGPDDAQPAHCALDGDSVDPPTLTTLGIEPAVQLPASATKRVVLAVNLDVRAPVPVSAWDLLNLPISSNFPSSITSYDSLGIGRQLTTYFSKVSLNSWDWHVVADGRDVEGGTEGVPFESASGTLTFNTDGLLQTEITNGSTWNFKGAAAGQTIAFDFGTSLAEGGTGLDGTTSFANVFSTNAATQDGYAAGSLASAVVSDVNVVGSYTNGQTRVLGRCP
ncbi:MAG TPA: flagellar basal body FlgE domain-containing protein [Polyangiales bacterium]|nr:flagellar basal body FlgE domain-containing protein [Polyangiales bacterium]